MPWLSRETVAAIREPTPVGWGQAPVADGAWRYEWGVGEPHWQLTLAVQQQVAWTVLAVEAIRRGVPVDVAPLPRDPDLLAAMRLGRRWVAETPTAILQDWFPGLTAAQVAAARALLLPAALRLDPDTLRAERLAELQAQAAQVQQWQQRLGALAAELDTYAPWLQAVGRQFQTYVTWFQQHLQNKAEKTANISRALEATATAVQWIPYVGQIIALVLIAVDVGVQVDAFRDQLRALAGAGGRIAAGQLMADAAEATAVTRTMLANAVDDLQWEAEILERERALLTQHGAASLEVGLQLAPGAGGGWGWLVGLAAAAAVVAALTMGARR